MLSYRDRGFQYFRCNEELSSMRMAHKTLFCKGGAKKTAKLFIYGACHFADVKLEISCNGHAYQIQAEQSGSLCWHCCEVAADHVLDGENEIRLWTSSPAMDGWSLGIDTYLDNRDSHLSTDGGETWREKRMGVYHNLSGEYIIRLLTDDENESPDPEWVWEDMNHPKFTELTELLPGEIRDEKDMWTRALKLSSWVCEQWEYNNSGTDYAPWDAQTILSWGKSRQGHSAAKPVVMCVHYAVVYTTLALSLGIPSRVLCTTGQINGANGHFVSEVWIEQWQKWCHVDANCDIVYIENGIPLSTTELREKGDQLPSMAVKGPSFEKQSQYIRDGADKWFITGIAFQTVGVWSRNDFLSHPEESPPAHGSSAYSETGWIWLDNGDPMTLAFPHRHPASALQAGPGL